MRHPVRPALGPLLFVVLAGLAFAPGARADSGNGVHDKCDACHVPALPGGSATNGLVCLGCHADVVQDDPVVASYRTTRRTFLGHVSVDGSPRSATPPGGGATIDAFDCLTCHDQHPNGRAHQLRDLQGAASSSHDAGMDEVSSFCLACHSDFGSFREDGAHYTAHPVGVTVRRRARRDSGPLPALLVDTRGTHSRDDDVVSCLSCHEVHRARHPYLLRWSEAEQAQGCTACHQFDAVRTRPRLTASLR